MSSCRIKLEDNYTGYYPEDVIEGKVICFFSCRNYADIKIKLIGEEKTSCEETEYYCTEETIRTKTRIKSFVGRNVFLEMEETLASDILIAGEHEYCINFVLPKDLPGSYRGKYGEVNFFLEATADRRNKILIEHIVEINVVALVNMNKIEDIAMVPTQFSNTEEFCCHCCVSGPVTINAQIEKQAFILGETVTIPVQIVNRSDEKIETMIVQLQAVVQAKLTHPTSKTVRDRIVIAMEERPGIRSQEGKTFFFKLLLPDSAVVPNFIKCQLLSQHCELEVIAILPAYHGNIKASTRVVVGHIPFVGRHQFQSTSMPFPDFLQDTALLNQDTPYPSAPPRDSAVDNPKGNDPALNLSDTPTDVLPSAPIIEDSSQISHVSEMIPPSYPLDTPIKVAMPRPPVNSLTPYPLDIPNHPSPALPTVMPRPVLSSPAPYTPPIPIASNASQRRRLFAQRDTPTLLYPTSPMRMPMSSASDEMRVEEIGFNLNAIHAETDEQRDDASIMDLASGIAGMLFADEVTPPPSYDEAISFPTTSRTKSE